MALADFFGRLGDNFSRNWDAAGPQGLASLGAAIASAPRNQWGTGLAQGLAGFRAEAEKNQKRSKMLDALKGIASNPKQSALLEALGPDNAEALLPVFAKSVFDDEKKDSGPFAGTGFDASAANILVAAQADPSLRSRPEYAIAYANLTSPRVVMGPDGNQMLYTPPVPQGIAPPSAGGQMAPPTPRAPVSTMRPSIPPTPTGTPTPPPANITPDKPGVFFEPDMHPELYAPTDAQEPPGTTPTITAVPGGITPIPGTGKAPIETQIKNQSFYIRQRASEETLNDPTAIEKFLDPSNAIPRSIGMGFLQSGPAQAVDQAGDEWVNALLRPDSGAAIPPAELATYRATYVPEWGDKPEKIAQKRAARVRAAEGIRAGLSPAQVVEAERVIARNPNPTLGKKFPAPPPEAVRDLKMRRDKAAFDEVFGPGAADKYLGQ